MVIAAPAVLEDASPSPPPDEARLARRYTVGAGGDKISRELDRASLRVSVCRTECDHAWDMPRRDDSANRETATVMTIWNVRLEHTVPPIQILVGERLLPTLLLDLSVMNGGPMCEGLQSTPKTLGGREERRRLRLRLSDRSIAEQSDLEVTRRRQRLSQHSLVP